MDPEPTIAQLKAHCLAKPDAFEDHPWGDTVFKVGAKGKIFCFCSSTSPSVTVKTSVENQAALVQLPNIKIAAYVGRYGWVSVNIDDEQTLELALDLIDESYGRVAKPPKKPKKS